MNPLTRLYNRLTAPKNQPSGRSNTIIVRKQAGIIVDHDSAMTYSAVWRAVNLISQSIAGLPWTVHERSVTASGHKRNTPQPANPLSNLLDLAPNDEIDSFTWKETMLAWALTWGNGYSEIEKDGAGRPFALWPIEPNRVKPDRTLSGQLVYEVSNGSAANTILYPDEMFHLKGLGFDGLCGYSVIGYAAKTIGMGLASEQYGADFYQNGAHASGVFEHPGTLGSEGLKNLRESINGTHEGAGKAHKNMILEEGMTWKQVTIPQNDAQFIESRKFQNTEVARWFGVPPHKLMEMEQSTFNNIEQQNIEFVTDSLLSWVKRLEMEANIKLVAKRNRGKVFTKLNLNGLLRGDSVSRSAYYKEMSNLGVFSVNEVRELEDMNPIGSEGDKRLVQLNLTTLDKIGEDLPQPAMPVPPEQDPEQPDMPPSALQLIDSVTARILQREHNAATDALTKFKSDRVGLMARMQKFYANHSQYIEKELAPLVNHFKLKVELDKFAANRCFDGLAEVANAFDTDQKEQPIITTSDDLAKQLIGV